MIRYNIIKNGIITNTWTSDFAGADYYEPCFGLPERLDEEGNILPAEYVLEIIDITSEIKAKEKEQKVKKLMDDADVEIRALMSGADFTTKLGEALFTLDMAVNIDGIYTPEQVAYARSNLSTYRGIMMQVQQIRAERDIKITELE